MKNPFKRTGFDSLIANDIVISGSINLTDNSTTIIDGTVVGEYVGTPPSRVNKGSTLIVGGAVRVKMLSVKNLTITGLVDCAELVIPGLLSIKAGATLTVKTLEYNELVIENGAKITVTGSMTQVTEPKTKIQNQEPEVQ